MTDDQIRLILARCPELTETDLVAALGSSASAEKASAEAFLPDDMVPVAVVGEILDVVISLEERMTALEAAVAHVGEDPVAICRRALADMAVEEKAAVVTELDRWVSLDDRAIVRLAYNPAGTPGPPPLNLGSARDVDCR